MRCALILAVASCACAPPLGAQETEEREVLLVVERLFEGMRTADSAMVRSPLAAGSGGRWEERIHDVEVRLPELRSWARGPMASVWTGYTLHLDGRVSHCGVDSVELLRGADGWKITQLADTRRTEGCGG